MSGEGTSPRSGVSQGRLWARKVRGELEEHGWRKARKERTGVLMWRLLGIKKSCSVHLKAGEAARMLQASSGKVPPGPDGCTERSSKPRV